MHSRTCDLIHQNLLFSELVHFSTESAEGSQPEKKVEKLVFLCAKGTWWWGVLSEPHTVPWIVIFERLGKSFGGFKEDRIHEFRESQNGKWKDSDSWRNGDGDGNF